MAEKPKILYYSGSTQHQHFMDELANMPPEFRFFASNKKYTIPLPRSKRYNIIQNKTKRYNLLVRLGRKVLRNLMLVTGLPRITPIHTSKDLVFSGRYVLHCNKPWIVSFEDVFVMLIHLNHNWNSALPIFIIKQYLKSEKCKAIIPWTEASKQSVLSTFDDPAIRKKMRIIYPCVPLRVNKVTKKTSKKKSILFLGLHFLRKGGWETVLAFERLKADATLNIVSSNIPPEIKKELSKKKNAKSPSSQEKATQYTV
ncbi:hypothetical protein ACFL96_15705, partial [Thermoproteota archaeon]